MCGQWKGQRLDVWKGERISIVGRRGYYMEGTSQKLHGSQLSSACRLQVLLSRAGPGAADGWLYAELRCLGV